MSEVDKSITYQSDKTNNLPEIDIKFYIEKLEQTDPSLSDIDYNLIHAARFQLSYEWIKEYLKPESKILELGLPGLFSFIIQESNPSIEVINTTTDLRYKFELPSGVFDVLLNMEVIEHIKDRDISDTKNYHEVSLFSMTGIDSFLTECNRVLKPGGLMFLTTPNMNSRQNIHRILNYLPPMNYYPHVREFTIGELKRWTEERGFEVIKVDTYDIYGEYQPGCKQQVESMLVEKGFLTKYRGDGIFMLLKKIQSLEKVSYENKNEIELLLGVELKDINLIIFPDWSKPEESLLPELERVMKKLAINPEKSGIMLLIDTSNISDEDANLILSSIAMNLMMQEDLDVEDGPTIYLLGEEMKGEVPWQVLLSNLSYRIILENENPDAIAMAGAEKLQFFTLEELSHKLNL